MQKPNYSVIIPRDVFPKPDKKEMYNELHENDELREKLGIDKTLLRHCSFSINDDHLEVVLVLTELMSGEYVLYETY